MRICSRILMLAAFLAVGHACLAQRVTINGRGGRGMGQLMQVWDEVQVLSRLVPLQLTDAQLSAMLQAYEQVPAGEPDEGLKKLLELKGRLLQGQPMVAADQAALREIFQGGQRRPGERNQPAPPEPAPQLSPLGQALWQLLTPDQQGILLGAPQGGGANNQKVRRDEARKFVDKLAPLRQVEEAAWPERRAALASALALAAGPAGSPQRQNSMQLFADFLDRVRQMPEADFLSKAPELAAELEALLPPGSSLTLVGAQLNPALVVQALEQSLLHFRARYLLQEVQQARRQPAPAPAP